MGKVYEERDGESHLAYAKQSNKVRKLTRQAKKEAERKIAVEVKTNHKNSGTMWLHGPKLDKEYLSLKSQTQQTAKESRQGQNRIRRNLMYYQGLLAEFSQRKIV